MTQGKDEIIKKIKKDAEKIVKSTLEEAGAKSKEIIAEAYNDASIFGQNYMERSFVQRDEIMLREQGAAKLEINKILLAKKQEMVSTAYEQSLKLIKQDKKKYAKLLEAMLLSVQEQGKVIFSQADKDIAESFLQDFNVKHSANFKISKQFGSFQGGLRVEGKAVDIDMTLEAEIALIREDTEPEVAIMIFGERNV